MSAEAMRERLEEMFAVRSASSAQAVSIRRLHDVALAFAQVIVGVTPACADQSAAVRQVREALMTAETAVLQAAPPAAQ